MVTAKKSLGLFIILILSFGCSTSYQGQNPIEHRERVGNLTCQGPKDEGLRHGLWVCRYQTGQVYSRINYRFGKRNGVMQLFGTNGRIDSISNWKNHLYDGVFQSYHPNGWLQFESNYLRGQLHGDLREWNAQGELIHHSTYERNSLKTQHLLNNSPSRP